MSSLDSIATYFMRVSQLRNELLSIGDTIDDGDLVSVTLNGFPTSWEPFLQGVCARAQLPSFDQLWTDRVQEEGMILSWSGTQKPHDEKNKAGVVDHARKMKGRIFPKTKDRGRRLAPNQEHKTRDLSKIKY